jgi:cytochrome b561
MLLRFVWNRSQPRPQPLNDHIWQNRLAGAIHILFYLIVLLLFVSGYLISTAKGQALDVFDWFSLPALLHEDAERAELAGDIHEFIANLFILMALLHAAAAVYHHAIAKDFTLNRMLGRSRSGALKP